MRPYPPEIMKDIQKLLEVSNELYFKMRKQLNAPHNHTEKELLVSCLKEIDKFERSASILGLFD